MLAKVLVLGVPGQTTTSDSRIVDKPKVGQDVPVCGSGGHGEVAEAPVTSGRTIAKDESRPTRRSDLSRWIMLPKRKEEIGIRWGSRVSG